MRGLWAVGTINMNHCMGSKIQKTMKTVLITGAAGNDVCFTPKSGHARRPNQCPLSAINGNASPFRYVILRQVPRTEIEISGPCTSRRETHVEGRPPLQDTLTGGRPPGRKVPDPFWGGLPMIGGNEAKRRHPAEWLNCHSALKKPAAHIAAMGLTAV